MPPPITRLRLIGLVEAVSFLVLLGVAMPLKYIWGMPQAVKVAGWIHGLLFVAFCVALAQVHQEERWRVSKSAGVLLAALLPFGPFVIDGRLRRDAEASRASGARSGSIR